jgi:hypothetical protein
VNLEMYLQAVNKGQGRCSWRPTASAQRYEPGGRDRARWICTSTPKSSELRDALADRGTESLEMNLEPEIQ